MAELKWTNEAELALRDIYSHIARNRPATAQRTIESVLNKIESLREAPTLGQAYSHHQKRNVRRITYGQFQIAYLIDDDQTLVILGVFHGLIFLPLK